MKTSRVGNGDVGHGHVSVLVHHIHWFLSVCPHIYVSYEAVANTSVHLDLKEK